ncbi:DMT family protein [uncultured Mucilaginibacter sp.]|uniref:DMT family protein n=1 Tax=uncultured Mucilaginibacter sp. TaxID=797541 RepID=UPI0025FC153E|nr:DMT family protein [uncultured Mucilaginibacter sp.]
MLARGIKTILFLIISNTFMTFAWYGHLRFKDFQWAKNLPLIMVILLSWGMAFFEYLFQVPANRAGFQEEGGPFSLLQLKVIQEALTITIFMIFTTLFFKTEKIAWNHMVGFGLIMLAVFVVFKKW